MINRNYTNNLESNTCLAKGNCSMTPDTGALREVFLNLFAYISDLFIKGNFRDRFTIDYIIRIIANSEIRNEYNNLQILNAFKTVFESICKLNQEANNIYPDIKLCIKSSSELTYTKIVNKGEQLLKSRQKYGKKKVNYYKDIMFFVLKSVISSYFLMRDYRLETYDIETYILNSLIVLEKKDTTFNDVKKVTEKLSELNLKLYEQIYSKACETFGEPVNVKVNTSTEKGNAILMSGTSLFELDNLLKATVNKELAVYTNGNLLVAHSFPHFKKYPHLKGHFANSTENTVLDFATFPGPVVLAKWEYQNIGNFYQGKFFSTNTNLPDGICHTDKDFKEAIEYSKSLGGFINTNSRPDVLTGIDYSKLNKKLIDIKSRLDKNELKNIIFIGLGTVQKDQKNYFDYFLRHLDKKTFVISFSHFADADNVLTLNVANNYPILLNVLKFIFKKLPPSDERMHFFVLRCDPNSMSTVISLEMSGVKNMFYWNCPPSTVNPSVIKVFRNTYGLKETSTPQNDYRLINKRPEI